MRGEEQMKRKLVTMLLACVMLANAGCTQNPPVNENGETVSSNVEEQVTEETTESTDAEAEENFEVIDISDDAVLKNLPTSWTTSAARSVTNTRPRSLTATGHGRTIGRNSYTITGRTYAC
jgi:uncharacterized secreted protein with C-terminal beta-propeller domain